MTSAAVNLKRAVRRRLPNDVVAVLRRRLSQPQPWDHWADLAPPVTPAGHHVGAPDFVGVGTQKSGTSWWYALLASHPGVHDVPGTQKERHFFSRYHGREFTSADEEAYHRWFPRPQGQLTGEWTPQYMHQVWVPPLLRQAAPQAKILVLLRDPVERYRSGLTHYLARDWDIDDRLAVDAAQRGLYGAQLERLYRSFPPEQVLVLQYEACRADSVAMARRTFEFLGLDPEAPHDGLAKEVNKTRVEKIPMPEHLRSTLIDLYRPDIEQLTRMVPDLDLDRWLNFRP